MEDIFWNLPAIVPYRAGTRLPFTISVVNEDGRARLFMLRVKTLGAGDRVITEDTVLVNGRAWFEVPADDREDVSGFLTLEETNVILGVYLMEQGRADELASVLTYLQGY